MFVTGVMALQTESNFAKRYAEGYEQKGALVCRL
jgi:hypothetical protein